MFRKIAAVLGLLFLIAPAHAVDNYSATEGAGKTFRCTDVGGVCIPWFIPSNSAGTAVGTVANPFTVTSTISGSGGNVAAVTAANALKVDGSAVTQTVSGTGAQGVNVLNTHGVSIVGTATVSPTGTLPVNIVGSVTQTVSGSGAQGVNVLNNLSTSVLNTVTVSPTGVTQVNCTGCSAAASVSISGTATVSGTGAQGVNVLNNPSVTVIGTAAISGNVREINSDSILNAVNSAIPLGNNAIGTVGISAVSSGGWSSFAMTNGPQSFGVIKAGSGIVHAQQSYTISSSSAWLKFYDKATNPSCGVDTVKKTLLVPANSTAALGGGNNAAVLDIQFATGIAWCLTTNIISTDAVSPAANNFVINVDFK